MHKKRGVKITCEVAPHHFYADEDIVIEKQSIAKVNPPLRTKEDIKEIIKGIKDGTIDVIATDHAPHSESEKSKDLYTAPFGISGIEIALPLTLTVFKKEEIDIFKLVEMMCINPRKILKLDDGLVRVGNEANLILVNLGKTQKVTEQEWISKGKNTPFIGEELLGVIEYTVLRDNIIYRRV